MDSGVTNISGLNIGLLKQQSFRYAQTTIKNSHVHAFQCEIQHIKYFKPNESTNRCDI